MAQEPPFLQAHLLILRPPEIEVLPVLGRPLCHVIAKKRLTVLEEYFGMCPPKLLNCWW